MHKKSKTPDAWKTMALLFEGHIHFYESRKDKDFAKKYGVKLDKSAVLVFEEKSKKPKIYDGLLKVRSLKKYLRGFAPNLDLPEEEKLPVVKDQSCWEKFCLKKGLCVLALLGDDESVAMKVRTFYFLYCVHILLPQKNYDVTCFRSHNFRLVLVS